MEQLPEDLKTFDAVDVMEIGAAVFVGLVCLGLVATLAYLVLHLDLAV